MIRRFTPVVSAFMLFVMMGIAMAQVAQRPQAGIQIRQQAQPNVVLQVPMPENPIRVLARFLQLTPDQTEGVKQLLDARKGIVEPLQPQIADKEKEFRDLLAAGTNPAAVGAAAIALDGLRRQVGEAHRQFVVSFEALLTAEQKTQLQALQRAARLQPVVAAARELGIF